MTQWLRALTAFQEVLDLIPSTQMAAHNCLKLQFQRIRHIHTDIDAGKTQCTKINEYFFLKKKINSMILFNIDLEYRKKNSSDIPMKQVYL